MALTSDSPHGALVGHVTRSHEVLAARPQSLLYSRSVDDDAELVVAIRNGDERAWAHLVDRHSGFLFRLARSVVNDRDLATDAMQTAWLQLLQHIDAIDNPAAVRSWLATTARREAMALSKARSRQTPTTSLEWKLDSDRSADGARSADPGELSALNEQHAIVREELRKLSEECQQILTMRAHRIRYAEISRILDMPVGSIGPKGQRCLDVLRKSPAIRALGAVT